MSTTAMFIFGGYRDVLRDAATDARPDATAKINEVFCGGGEIEAAQLLDAVADKIDAAVRPLLAEQNGPGVWHYDVAEPLGTRLANAAAVSVQLDDEDIVRLAVALTREWLAEVNE